MHEPTPQTRRVAALRYQAERLLQDAAAWGLTVEIFTLGGMDGPRTRVRVEPIPAPHDNKPAARPPATAPAPSRQRP